MIEMIKSPPDEFKEVVSVHFALKPNGIIETIDKWIEVRRTLWSQEIFK